MCTDRGKDRRRTGRRRQNHRRDTEDAENKYKRRVGDMLTAKKLIEHLGLESLPVEGGRFRQTYCAAEKIPRSALPRRYRSDKVFGTAIYYLLTSEADSFSALHQLPTDEVYHFYLGDPVEMLLLDPDGASRRVVLGQDILRGQQVQFVVPRGVWQCSP